MAGAGVIYWEVRGKLVLVQERLWSGPAIRPPTSHQFWLHHASEKPAPAQQIIKQNINENICFSRQPCRNDLVVVRVKMPSLLHPDPADVREICNRRQDGRWRTWESLQVSTLDQVPQFSQIFQDVMHINRWSSPNQWLSHHPLDRQVWTLTYQPLRLNPKPRQ